MWALDPGVVARKTIWQHDADLLCRAGAPLKPALAGRRKVPPTRSEGRKEGKMRRGARISVSIAVTLLVILTAAFGSAQNGPATPYRLTLEDAIHRGLQANLGVLVAETRTQEADGDSREEPVAVAAAAADRNPGDDPEPESGGGGHQHARVPLPQVVGPFSVYDSRAFADLPIVDMQLWHGLRAARQSTAASKARLSGCAGSGDPQCCGFVSVGAIGVCRGCGGRVAGGYGAGAVQTGRRTARRGGGNGDRCATRRGAIGERAAGGWCRHATGRRVRC